MRHPRIWSRNHLVIASGAVVLCTALGVGLFLEAYASLARSSFRDRAAAYAQAFAATADSWLSRGQTDIAKTLASFLVTGSVVSVEVTGADGAILLRAGSRSSGTAEETAVSSAPPQKATGDELLVVDVPLPSSSGRVRMEVDASSSELVVRHAALLAIGGAALFDAGVVGLLAWALRGRRRSAQVTGPPVEERKEDGRIAVGELVIVPARCEASYAGHPLHLTPKQFALLGVLASEPGRVFTEAEILERAWPDSPYADARDIKQYVYLLRRRLADIRPDGREAIVTVAGFGYRLNDGR